MTYLFSRRQMMTLLAGVGLAGFAQVAMAAPPASSATPATSSNLRLAVVLPSKQSAFYKACQDGAQEAVTAVGGVDVVFVAPDKPVARDQIALVNGLIKQKVDAIAIAPVEGNALGPSCRRAMARGIKVVSFGEALPVGVRLVHLSGSSPNGKARAFMSMLADDLKQGGDVAILAGDRQDDADGTVLSQTMREWLKPAYGKLKLAATSYGNVDDKASYAATENLLKDHPDLKGILVFNPPALVGAARYVQDNGLAGKVFVTGFGRPSQLKLAMAAQVVEYFAFTNPIDLGYGAVEIAVALAKKQASADAGSTIAAGRLGQIAIGKGNVATLAPLVIDEKNFDKFADVD